MWILHDSPVPHGKGFEKDLVESLVANRIAPKLLYVTPRQTDLWRQVFLRHSPIHANPEFARIYREAFARTAEKAPPDEVYVIGLGCGTGMKEAGLAVELQSRGRRVRFSPIDISQELVDESRRKLVEAGAAYVGHKVCDLTEVDAVAQWISETGEEAPIIFTFFGMVPNLAPSVVTRLFREILKPGDVVLVSAHLAPVEEGVELEAAMKKVLPQYDNAETLAWLAEALETWGLADRLGAPKMEIGQMEGAPAFVAKADWISPVEPSKQTESLELFHSLRYTPELFEQLLREEGFHFQMLAMTDCREEAIWAVRLRR